MPDPQTIRYYDQNAAEVARRYEAMGSGLDALLPFLFRGCRTVLEIGSGSGRDAARLLALGLDVHAVEPSAGLLEASQGIHPELRGRVFPGLLPGSLPPQLRPKYDAILLSAVLMHIPDGELFDSVFQLRERLEERGRVVLSMPTERPDVPGGSDRDERGRLMIVRPVAQVRLLFERLGFDLENEWTSEDSGGRKILWKTLLFRLSGSSRGRAIDQVESIINADRKTATYKLALIRALSNLATTSWAQGKWEDGDTVSVPLSEVSDRWLLTTGRCWKAVRICRRSSPSWNLFPATRSVNNAKRDKLPSAGLLRRQQEVGAGRFGREIRVNKVGGASDAAPARRLSATGLP